MTSTITFTPEAVKDVLLAAGFTEFAYSNIDRPGFKIQSCREVIVRLKGVGVSDFQPGQGPRALLDEYLQVLDQAGYEVQSIDGVVVVAGVKG